MNPQSGTFLSQLIDAELVRRWQVATQRQCLLFGGFCERCGEACAPFYPGLPPELKEAACEYNGRHPTCSGDHNLVFAGKTPPTFGSYEIYVCVNPGCDYSEAY